MRTLFLFLLFLAQSVIAQPYLVSDPYVPASDPNLNPVSFVIHGLATSDITVQATQLSNGNIVLQYNLANLANGQYSVDAAAINVFGGESPFSAPPFAFTKGVPSPPTNLRISPTILTWIPSFSKIPRTLSPFPLRRPLPVSFSLTLVQVQRPNQSDARAPVLPVL